MTTFYIGNPDMYLSPRKNRSVYLDNQLFWETLRLPKSKQHKPSGKDRTKIKAARKQNRRRK